MRFIVGKFQIEFRPGYPKKCPKNKNLNLILKATSRENPKSALPVSFKFSVGETRCCYWKFSTFGKFGKPIFLSEKVVSLFQNKRRCNVLYVTHCLGNSVDQKFCY